MEPIDKDRPWILLVDDEKIVLHTLRENLIREKYNVIATTSPREAIDHLQKQQFAVIVSDQVMPEMTGLEFLGEAKKIQPNASRIIVTAVMSLNTVIDAINKGEIFRFLAKPWVRAELLATVQNAVQRYQLIESNLKLQADTLKLNQELAQANEELRQRMIELEQQKRDLASAHLALRKNFDHSLELCYRLINSFDPVIGSHTKIVVEICKKMAETEFLDQDQKYTLIVSAWLHDIGLIGFSRDLLRVYRSKERELATDEVALIHSHPIYGQTIASFVDKLKSVGDTIRAHHERFDGQGYPDGLAGQAIPWPARCLAVAVYFSETGLPKNEAIEVVLQESGKALDPEAVRLFLKATQMIELPKKVKEILLEELKPGMLLAKGIYSPMGLLLVAEGQELNSATIAKLKNHSLLTSVTQRLLVYS